MTDQLLTALFLCMFAAFFVGFVIAAILISDRLFHTDVDRIFKPKGNYNTGKPTISRKQVAPPPPIKRKS